MLEKSFGLLFFLKSSKSQRDQNLRTVYLRITVNGSAKELSTKRIWPKERWSQSAGRATGNKEDARALNNYLDVLCSEVYKVKQRLIESGKAISADALKNLLTGQGDEYRKIVAVFDDHNAQMKALVGTEFAPSTLTRYKTARDHTAAFIKFQYGKDDLALSDLNYEFVTRLAPFMRQRYKPL